MVKYIQFALFSFFKFFTGIKGNAEYLYKICINLTEAENLAVISLIVFIDFYVFF